MVEPDKLICFRYKTFVEAIRLVHSVTMDIATDVHPTKHLLQYMSSLTWSTTTIVMLVFSRQASESLASKHGTSYQCYN